MASENKQEEKAATTPIEKILLHHPFLPSLARKLTEILKSGQRGQNKCKNIKRFLKQLSSDAKLHRTSLLIEAVRSHRDDALRLLLENGASVNVDDLDGNSPLHLALLTGQKGMASILLHYGAAPDSVNLAGQTPLHIASEQRLPTLVRKILGMGSDVNALDKDRRTPLIMASFGGSAAVVKVLLKHGADPAIRDVRGWDAVGYAKICNYIDVIQVLSGDFKTRSLSPSSSVNALRRRDSCHDDLSSPSSQASLVCRSSAAAGDRCSGHSHRSQLEMKSRFKSSTDVPSSGNGKYREPGNKVTATRTISISSLTESCNELTYTTAKVVLGQARRRVEGQLKWRRTILEGLARMDEELERMEQRVRRETRDKQVSEQAAEEVDTKLDKLTRHLIAIKTENEKLRFQHTATEDVLQAAELRKKLSSEKLMEKEYRGLLWDLTEHADEVKHVSDSVSEYLKMEEHSNMEKLELLTKLVFSTEDHELTRHELVVRLNVPLKTIWMSLWIMASDIKITELLLNNQRTKNAMLQDTMTKIVTLSDDITQEYHHVLRAFYEGKSHQDMLDTLASELDTGVKECLYVINSMAMK